MQWIEVLEDLGVFSVTIAKFGHGLRDEHTQLATAERACSQSAGTASLYAKARRWNCSSRWR